MHILVSNDDGYQSDGLQILVEHLSLLADITVVAPNQNHSAASHSLTLRRPLHIEQINERTFAVDGTPTDCIHLAITGLFSDRPPPDMVVSGINHGENLGDDVLYSGTVAAAMEGRFLGLPALAISAVSSKKECLETAALVAQKVVKNLMQGCLRQALSKDVVLNINVPDCPLRALKGIQSTRLGNRHPSEPAIKEKDPHGNTIYWVGLQGKEQDAGRGTDFFAIANNHVSVTPLHIDLTKYKDIENLSACLDKFHLHD